MQLLPAEPLVPHRGSMRLLDGVWTPTGDGIQAESMVTEKWPLARDGTVSPLICVELAAQAISALSTWRRGEGARPRVGLLVGIKEAEFSAARIPVKTRLIVQMGKLYQIGNYAVFQGQVRSEWACFCKITVQVMEPEEDLLSNLKAWHRT